MCLQKMMGPHRVEWASLHKTARSHSRLPTGAWFWRRKGRLPLRKRHWKNYVARIGDRFMASSGDRELKQKRRKISLKVFLRYFWSAGIWMLSAKRKGACVLIC